MQTLTCNLKDIILVDVSMIAKIWNPFTHVIWSTDLETPITTEEVRLAIETQSLISPADASMCKAATPEEARLMHSSRIAWLVQNMDSEEASRPIEIDFGVPRMPGTRFEICDGNHRFAAFLYSNKQSIKASWGGCSGEAARFVLE